MQRLGGLTRSADRSSLGGRGAGGDGGRLFLRPSYVAAVLADGPIAWWRLGELVGTVAADSAGSHTGSYTGSPVPTLGAPGVVAGDPDTAVTLASGGYIQVPDAADIRFAGVALSAEAWIKPVNPATATQIIFGAYQITSAFPGWAVILSVTASTRLISYWSGTTAAWVSSTGTIPADGLWHHVVVTVSAGGAVTFYIDGQPAGTAASNPPNSFSGAKGLGARNAGTFPFVGGLDEMALYPTVLSAARVLAHYNTARGL